MVFVDNVSFICGTSEFLCITYNNMIHSVTRTPLQVVGDNTAVVYIILNFCN